MEEINTLIFLQESAIIQQLLEICLQKSTDNEIGIIY